MIDYNFLRILLRRRLFKVGYSSKEITELLDEFSVEEMFELGIFHEAKFLINKNYKIDESGKLTCRVKLGADQFVSEYMGTKEIDSDYFE